MTLMSEVLVAALSRLDFSYRQPGTLKVFVVHVMPDYSSLHVGQPTCG